MQVPPSSLRRRRIRLTRDASAKPAQDRGKHKSRFERLKPWLDIVQAVLALVGVVAGYYWFTQQRLDKPNVELDQTITQRALEDGAHSSTLITLDVHAKNIGKVRVQLDHGKVELLQINPPGKGPAMPFDLGKMTLEPGESDQALFRTIIIPDGIRTLQVHARYPVPGTNNYWSLLSAVDIGMGEARKEATTSVR